MIMKISLFTKMIIYALRLRKRMNSNILTLVEEIENKHYIKHYKSEHIIKFNFFLLNSFVVKNKSKCIMSSLILFRFLKESEVNPVINIGVRRINGKTLGHCWVTIDGVSIMEKENPEQVYTIFHKRGEVI